MASTYLTTSEITYETVRTLVNTLAFAAHVNRQYDDRFAIAGAKIGDTINIRKPVRYVVNEGRVAVIQDITETYVPLTLTTQLNIGLNYTSVDLTLSIDNFRERIIRPAVVPIANRIDYDGLQLYKQIYNMTGTPGTMPSTIQPFADAGARLLNEATPDDDTWCMILNPTTEARVWPALAGLFNPQAEISRQYERGRMGQAANFNWYHGQNVAIHTVGGLGGTPLVNNLAGLQTGSSLVTDTWTNAAATRLNIGDVFTIDGVFATNPQSHQSTGELRQFVVTAPGISDAGGNMTISISPAITTSGPFQTVTNSPANNAPLTIMGTAGVASAQNIAFHPDAFALGFADLVPPKNGESYRVVDDEIGVAMRVWESSDFINDLHGVRLDVLYGWCVIYPELACRVAS